MFYYYGTVKTETTIIIFGERSHLVIILGAR